MPLPFSFCPDSAKRRPQLDGSLFSTPLAYSLSPYPFLSPFFNIKKTKRSKFQVERLWQAAELEFNKVLFSLGLFFHLSAIYGKWYWSPIGAIRLFLKLHLFKAKI